MPADILLPFVILPEALRLDRLGQVAVHHVHQQVHVTWHRVLFAARFEDFGDTLKP